MLECGGFQLHKWCANTPELLAHIPHEQREKKVQLAENDGIKTHRLIWQPTNDTFVVSVDRILENSTTITKRTVLSDIAKLYDPLGLTGPIIVTAKVVATTA
jgi:translation initiation factor IF-1